MPISILFTDSEMKRLKVAIIGQGRSGRDIHGNHLIKDKSRYKIIAVSDILKERCERAMQEYGCYAYSDYRQLFRYKDLDLIVNALPSNMHVPVSLEILNAGFNCLCEKPVAQRIKDVDKLIVTAKKNKKILAIYQQSRFAPYFQQIKKVIKSGVLGRIVQINIAFSGFVRRYDWQTLQKFMGGNLLNTGPHPLDQALQLFGTDIMPEIFCHMDSTTTVGNAEDHVIVILKGKNRPLIHLEISSCKACSGNLYEVYGTKGGLKGSMIQMEWQYFDSKRFPPPKQMLKPLCKPDGTPAYPSEEIKWTKKNWCIPKSQSDLFAVISKRFYLMLWRTLTNGAPLEITPMQVRQQVAVIEECQKQNSQIYRKASFV